MDLDLENAMIQKMKLNASNASNASNGMGPDAKAVAVWRWALRGIVIQNQ
jgi:hypothetical protein